MEATAACLPASISSSCHNKSPDLLSSLDGIESISRFSPDSINHIARCSTMGTIQSKQHNSPGSKDQFRDGCMSRLVQSELSSSQTCSMVEKHEELL